MNSTLVTALYNINRENQGDGRKWQDYINWLRATLQLKSNFIVFTEPNVADEIPRSDNIKIVTMPLENIPFYDLRSKIQSIINSEDFLNKIEFPERVECKLALYNIVLLAKLEWLRMTINSNPFNTDCFFWIDAGASRFFDDLDLSKPFPLQLPSKFLIQGNVNTSRVLVDNDFKWSGTAVLVGTFFGGLKDYVIQVADKMQEVLYTDYITHNVINIDQNAFAIVQKRYPELFEVYIELNGKHLPILKCMQNEDMIAKSISKI